MCARGRARARVCVHTGPTANAKKTGGKDQDPFLAGVTEIEWKRPYEWGDPEQVCVVWSGGVDPDDVAQGRLGNCYFLAGLCIYVSI